MGRSSSPPSRLDKWGPSTQKTDTVQVRKSETAQVLMMVTAKLYGGMRRETIRWLIVAQKRDGSIMHEICLVERRDLEGFACALLQEHLSVSAGCVDRCLLALRG